MVAVLLADALARHRMQKARFNVPDKVLQLTEPTEDVPPPAIVEFAIESCTGEFELNPKAFSSKLGDELLGRKPNAELVKRQLKAVMRYTRASSGATCVKAW